MTSPTAHDPVSAARTVQRVQHRSAGLTASRDLRPGARAGR